MRMGVRTSWNVAARLRREPELGRPRGRDPLTAKAQRRAGGHVTRASASNGHRVPKPDATRAHYTKSQHTRRDARCGDVSHESESHEARNRLKAERAAA